MRGAYIIYDEPICEPNEFQQGLSADSEDIKDTEWRQWKPMEWSLTDPFPQILKIRQNLPVF